MSNDQISNASLHLYKVGKLHCAEGSRHEGIMKGEQGFSGPNAFLIKYTANPEPDSTDM